MNIMDSLMHSHEMLENIMRDNVLLAKLQTAANVCVTALENGNKIIFMGNGGSAAEAQHLAAELVGSFMQDRPAIAAIALTTDTSALTAIGNDFGYRHVFSRQLQAIAKPGDIGIYLSTSGRSENIIDAMEDGTIHGMTNIAFCGENTNDMQEWANYVINIPSSRTPQIQEGHLILGHILCEYIEENINANRKKLSKMWN